MAAKWSARRSRALALLPSLECVFNALLIKRFPQVCRILQFALIKSVQTETDYADGWVTVFFLFCSVHKWNGLCFKTKVGRERWYYKRKWNISNRHVCVCVTTVCFILIQFCNKLGKIANSELETNRQARVQIREEKKIE